MIGYGTLGSNDVTRAARFYDDLLAGVGDKAHELHAKALTLGATDEGAPGPRGDGWYCGYVRDLDGHKLNFFCMVLEEK
jgi:hypothetical protein